jgi:hypothetical protein
MNQQTFNEEINKIMHYGLSLNVIDGMSTSQLIDLLIEPEKHIKKRLITSKNIIDERKQMRDLESLKDTDDYKNIIASISKLKKDSSWLNNIESFEIRRDANGNIYVS